MDEYPRIAFMTDFGTQDIFTGVVKGVISQVNPRSKVIDLCHDIPPGDILRAAIFLWQSVSYFSQETIFLVVVDPGVGSTRKPIVLQSQDRLFVGPDNGVFTFFSFGKYRAFELSNEEFHFPTKGTTFHGRDIFGPVAAFLSKGIPFHKMGHEISSLNTITLPLLSIQGSKIIGETLFSDRFGNFLTSLGVFTPIDSKNEYHFTNWIPGKKDTIDVSLKNSNLVIDLPKRKETIGFYDHYLALPENQCGALVSSSGLVEIAAKNGRAVDVLDLKQGQYVTIIQND